MLGWIFLILMFCAAVVAFVLLARSEDNLALITLDDVLQGDCSATARIFWFATVLVGLFLLALFVLWAIDSSRVETIRFERRIEYVETSPLKAVSTTGNTSSGKVYGAFGFAYGYLTTDNNYVFMYETADGGYRKTTIDSDVVTIYELHPDSEEVPRMERWATVSYTTTIRNEANKKFFRPFWRDLEPIKEETERGGELRNGDTYKIYVPQGSVVESYNFVG